LAQYSAWLPDPAQQRSSSREEHNSLFYQRSMVLDAKYFSYTYSLSMYGMAI
jgi:hypothetical protein